MIKILFISFLITFALAVTVHNSYISPQRQTKTTITYAIVATNDIHGGVFPKQYVLNKTAGTKYKSGGLTYFGNMLNTLRKQYGNNNVIYLDAGDQIQGALQASPQVSNGTIMRDFYDIAGLKASTIGNHQFDFGPQVLDNYMGKRKGQFLIANVFDDKGNDATKIFKNTKKSDIFTLGDNKNSLRMGVIGLTTSQTPSTTSGLKLFTTKFDFKNYSAIVLEEATKLKKQKADVIVLATHVGNECINTSLEYKVWRNTTNQITCNNNDQMTTLLRSLPKGTINAVVQGHRHVFSHVWVDNIPVVGVANLATYFNVIYLQVNKKTKQVVNSAIEGPIPICEKIFQATKKCNYLTPTQISKAGRLTNWKFHGQLVQQDKKLSAAFDKWLPNMKPFLVRVCDSEEFIKVLSSGQNQPGNLFADLMLSSSGGKADFSIVSSGNFRTSWPPGTINQGQLQQMFPFIDTKLVTSQITGQELVDTIKATQLGSKYYYPTAGLSQVVKTVGGFPKQLISLTKYDGSAIVPTQTYTLVLPDFLINGGDDFKNVIGKVWTPKNTQVLGFMRDLMRIELKKVDTIKQNSHIDQNKPRLKLVIG